jgi:hypothetical protein
LKNPFFCASEKVTNCAAGLGMPILILSAAHAEVWKKKTAKKTIGAVFMKQLPC